MSGFENPIVGGTALRIPAIQSPNYSAGSNGWIIKIDGSAEFNNLTVRGTFQGVDFIINSSGIFLYSAAPAAGNLIGSWTQSAGTDAYGNKYDQGVISYSPTGLNAGVYAALTQGTVQLGNITSAVGPDFSNSGDLDSHIASVSGSTYLRLLSPHNNAVNDTVPAPLWMTAGMSGATTGSTTVPYALLSSDTQLSPVDLVISGNIIKDIGFDTRASWQTPTAAAGWTIGTLKYRFDAFDNVVWTGYISQNTGVAGAGAAFTTVAVPAAYRPAAALIVPCAWVSSGSVCKGAGAMGFNHDGTVSVFWPATTANGDRFEVVASIPLGHLT